MSANYAEAPLLSAVHTLSPVFLIKAYNEFYYPDFTFASGRSATIALDSEAEPREVHSIFNGIWCQDEVEFGTHWGRTMVQR